MKKAILLEKEGSDDPSFVINYSSQNESQIEESTIAEYNRVVSYQNDLNR